MRNGIATILKTVAGLRGNEKLEFLVQIRDDKNFQAVVRAALDPYLNYPISVNEWPPLGDDPSVRELQAMHEVLESMHLGLLTSTEAEAAVEVLSDDYPRLIPILYRILGRNLRCGIGVATAKKVWEGLIPEFEIAEIGTDIAECEFPIAAEYNYVGERLFGVMTEGSVTIYNKKGRAMHRLQALRLELDRLGEELEEDYVFEGVLVPNDGCYSKYLSDRNARFYIFDWVPASLWKERATTDSFEYRQEFLAEAVELYREMYSHTLLWKAPTVVIEKEQQLHELYLTALNEGCKGLILKDLAAPYDFGGSRAMLRWHPTEILQLPVVEIYGEASVAAFKVAYKDSLVCVRYGLAPDEREDLWRDQQKILGKKIRVLVQTSGDKLRFVRYLGVVDDA